MKYGTVVNNAKDDTKAVFLGYAKINYGPEPDVFIPATEAERKQFEEEQS